MKTYRELTNEDVVEWTTGAISNFAIDYLCSILSGSYDLDEAREDILSIINHEEDE